MDIEQLLYQYNPWWEQGYQFDGIIDRDKTLVTLYPLMDIPEVLVITGLRRVGKTTLMKSLIRYLISRKKIRPMHCLYVSVDDYQLSSMSIIDILEEYRRIMKISVSQKVYIFLDEVTYIKNFQIQLKNIYDKGNVKCIVSSSSSSVLKDDSAYLTGRKRIVEINPLDFDEYLAFKNIHISKADKSLFDSHFLDYMQIGGMPEYVLRGEREYLVSLIDDIIMKDIVAYHGIRNPGVIKEFFVLLMERAGKQISINKIANILKISPDTAKRYLTMFEQTYLIQLVSRFGKTNEALLATKKVYATDIGMRNVIVGFRDKEAVFENIVFMKIKHMHPRYVYTNGQEIDFLVDQALIEVKYQKSIEGKQLAAFEAYQAGRKIIIQNYLDLEKLKL